MSWVNTHKIPFESRLGDQYEVRIYVNTDESPVAVTLTGSDIPFVTQEDDNSDIFESMRVQTGYLRVVDTTENGDLLETMMPKTNTEKLVRVYHKDTGSTPSVDTLLWQGFMCAEAFSQNWDNQRKVIEFPVKSLLAALEDVSIASSDASVRKNFAWYIVKAFEALGESPIGMNIISNLDDMDVDMLQLSVDAAMFFSEDEEQNEGSTKNVLVGESYADILSAIAKLFGVCFRYQDGYLYLTMYDNAAGKVGLMRLTWADLGYAAAGTSPGSSIGGVPEVELLESVEFQGVDNVASFVQGAKEAIVRLSIADKSQDIIEMPMTSEDQTTTYEIVRHDSGHEGEAVIYTGQVYVQPHPLRVNSVETFYFYEYQTTGYHSDPTIAPYAQIGASDLAACLANSVIFEPLFAMRASTSQHAYTGCFPVRWMYKKDASSSPQMKSGLMMNTLYLESISGVVEQQPPGHCYKIESELSQELRDGYLHITMTNLNFMRGGQAADQDKLYFGEFTSLHWQNRPYTMLYCILTVGNMEWNPDDGWTEHSGNYTPFIITFDGDGIKTNKTTEMSVDENDGFFVPVPTDVTVSGKLTGKVALYITNISHCYLTNDGGVTNNGDRDAHCRIITDLRVEFLQTVDPMASRRNNNTYRRTILESGFSSERTIDLTIGTNNNNIPSHCFIKRGDELVDSLTYYYDEHTTEDERPEKNLLARMVEQLKEVRRTFTGVLKSKYNALATYRKYDMRFGYLDRKFFAVVKAKDWREDMEEVKFIEVTDVASPGPGPQPQNPGIAWSADSASATIGGTNTFPTLSNPHSLPITYASSDTSVATVDASGVVTLVAAGSANISASFAGSAEYYASTVTYALAVALPYDAEVEYLQATGTQYINTLFVPIQDNFRVVADAEKTVSGGDNMLVYVANASGYYFNLNWYAQTAYFRFRGDSETITAATGRHLFELGSTSKVDSSSVSIGGSLTLVGNTTAMWIGRSAGGSYFKGKIYSVQAYYGDTLVLDLIPVRIGQVGYMYDTVSGELFGNSGTGSFTLGPDKNQ